MRTMCWKAQLLPLEFPESVWHAHSLTSLDSRPRHPWAHLVRGDLGYCVEP